MKVLSILTYYEPHWTGLSRHATWLAEEMAAAGHEVTVLTSRHRRDLPAKEKLNGVTVIRLGWLIPFSRAMISLLFPFQVVRLIRDSDVVQVHTPLPECLLVAAACKVLRRPLVMSHHGDFVTPDGLGNRVLQSAAHGLSRVTASLADAVTSYSLDYAAESELLKGCAAKLVPVRPPVRIPQPASRSGDSLRRELGLGDKTLIGIAGRWVLEKGFDDLLKALPRIREAFPDAHIVFAGETRVAYDPAWREWAALHDGVKEHVTMIGLITDRARLASFYSMLDVFVLPSRTDMLGIVQVEAMMCGTPVVATDIPGARTLVRETGFGRLAPSGSPEGLAAAVVEVLEHPDRFRPDAGRVGRLYEPSAAARSILSLMTRLVDGPCESPLTPAMTQFDLLLETEADMAFRRRARSLVRLLAPAPGESILDCGCGRGFYTRALRAIFRCEAVGVDASLSDLSNIPGSRTGFVAATVTGQGLPFKDEAFDKVLMSEVLEHLEDDTAALRECRRVLKAGGVLGISVPHASYPFLWDPINWIITAVGGPPIRRGPLVGIWTNHRRLYSAEQLAYLVADAGFEVDALDGSTHSCLPFNHFLLYGIGKPMVERGWLPAGITAAVDRSSSTPIKLRRLNPLYPLIAMARWVDSSNDRPRAARKKTQVNLVLKARKLQQAQTSSEPLEAGGKCVDPDPDVVVS